MNYLPYNPYAYGPYGPQQALQSPYMPQGAQPVQPQNAQQPIQGLSTASRPVASREEAASVAADFSGSLMVFPDVTHDRVYLKRWDVAAGAAQFQEYAPAPPAVPQQEGPQAGFVSLQDFQQLREFSQNLQEMVEALRQEVESLKRPGELKPSPRTTRKEKPDADT